jgi:diketogulonate reductase-like aldo/keto reductase
MTHNNIALASYAPLSPLTKNPGGPIDSTVEKLATKYKKTASQILLKWVQQQGSIFITTTDNPSRVKDQFNLRGFELTTQEVKEVEDIGRKNIARYHLGHIDTQWDAQE